MVKFNKKDLLLLQQKLYKHTSQKLTVRDASLLNSAIESPFQTFDGNELYSSIEEKGARLCFNIINNHPFIDGNKRMGILIMLCFLQINGLYLKYTNEDLINLGLSVASGTTSYNEIVSWIKFHKSTVITKPNELNK